MRKIIIVLVFFIGCTNPEIKKADQVYLADIAKAESYRSISVSSNPVEIGESLYQCGDDLENLAKNSHTLRLANIRMTKVIEKAESNQWKVDIINYVLWAIGIFIAFYLIKFIWKFRKLVGIPI